MSEIIEGKPQLAPGFCFICELSNPVRYLDTFRDFEGVVRERLDGRKYLCEECIAEGATKLGFITPQDATEHVNMILSLKEELRKMKETFTQFEDLKAIVDSVGGKISIEVAPKKVVAKKAA